jgi:undecaprenyl-diphosphatase
MYGAVWIALGLVLALSRRRPLLFAGVVAAVAGADLVADLGKLLVHRRRPFEHQLGPAAHTHSFPSGHASTSFAGATMLAAFAPRYRAGLYVLACAIAYSRLYDGVHYPTDVVAGAVLGVLTALLLLAAARRRSRRSSRSG